MGDARRWWWSFLCGLLAVLSTACDNSGSGSSEADSAQSFYLLEADPADVPVIRLPSDSGEVEARVGPRPDGGAGLGVVDAFGAFPGRVVCAVPDADGRLFVPLKSPGQPSVFIDDRVVRVTVQSDVEPERELQLIDVPGVPGARVTQGTAQIDSDLNAAFAFYDEAGVNLSPARYRPPSR